MPWPLVDPQGGLSGRARPAHVQLGTEDRGVGPRSDQSASHTSCLASIQQDVDPPGWQRAVWRRTLTGTCSEPPATPCSPHAWDPSHSSLSSSFEGRAPDPSRPAGINVKRVTWAFPSPPRAHFLRVPKRETGALPLSPQPTHLLICWASSQVGQKDPYLEEPEDVTFRHPVSPPARVSRGTVSSGMGTAAREG